MTSVEKQLISQCGTTAANIDFYPSSNFVQKGKFSEYPKIPKDIKEDTRSRTSHSGFTKYTLS